MLLKMKNNPNNERNGRIFAVILHKIFEDNDDKGIRSGGCPLFWRFR